MLRGDTAVSDLNAQTRRLLSCEQPGFVPGKPSWVRTPLSINPAKRSNWDATSPNAVGVFG
jgi:hypothetical protein